MFTDEQLVAKAQAGDRHAESDIVKRYDRLVHKLARQRRPYSDDIDDLLQEGRIGVLRAVRLFRADRGVRFMSYVYRAVHGTLCDALRNDYLIRVPRSPGKRDWRPVIAVGLPADIAERRRNAAEGELDLLIESLPEIEQQVVLLRRQDMMLQEIADRLGTKVSTTRRHLLSAIGRMRRFARRCG